DIAAQHCQPVEQITPKFGCNLFKKFTPGLRLLEFLGQVDGLAMFYETMFPAPEQGDELSETCNPHLFLVGGVFKLERGALIDNALWYEENGHVRLPLDLEEFQDRVRSSIGRFATQKEQGCIV